MLELGLLLLLAQIGFDDVLFLSPLSAILDLLKQQNRKKLKFDIKLTFALVPFGKKKQTPDHKHLRVCTFKDKIIQVRRDLRWSSSSFPFLHKFSIY